MREINRSTILELIRRNGPIGRSQIAEEHHISLPTVMRIVESLIQDGLVIEEHEKEWSGGRRRARVRFNGSRHLVVAIDMSGEKLYGAIADLDGELCHEICLGKREAQPEAILESLFSLIDQLLEKAGEFGLPVRGLCVGVPGTVLVDSGIVERSPSLGWVNFPLKDLLASRYAYPIALENDVNLAALGEAWFGLERCEESVVLLSIGDRVGAGVIINGAVYPGAHHMAGELPPLFPAANQVDPPAPVLSGSESLSSEPKRSEPARRCLSGAQTQAAIDSLDAEGLFPAANRPECQSAEIAGGLVDWLSQLVRIIQAILDPEVILLTADQPQTTELVIKPLLEQFRERSPSGPRVRASRLGRQAAVMGAIIRVLRITSKYYSLQKFN